MSITEYDTVFVDGSFVPALTSERQTAVNPTTGEVNARVPACGAEDVDRAVAAARKAFDESGWANTTVEERAEALERFAAAMDKRAERMQRLITEELGIAYQLAGPIHIEAGINHLRFFAEQIRGVQLEEVRQTFEGTATVRRCPVGVVAVLIPWNIPLIGATSKMCAALAAGCTIVYKPDPQTPLISYVLAEAVEEAQLPPGVINVVTADLAGSQHLVAHPDVDMIAFTGSTAVGAQVNEAAAPDFKRIALELGGNAAAIVLDDAPAELIAAGIIRSCILINNGEACIAQRRFLVPRDRLEELTQAAVYACSQVVIGDPMEPTTMLGPLINERQQQRVIEHAESAKAEGAVIACGGKVPDHLPNGYFVEPTVLSGVTRDMRVANEETFGPLVCLMPYDSVEEAIEIAKDTPFGLSSSVWSADVKRAEEIGRTLRVGAVYINGALDLAPNVPFGGFGHSGKGRELGIEGLDEYIEYQSVYLPGDGAGK